MTPEQEQAYVRGLSAIDEAVMAFVTDDGNRAAEGRAGELIESLQDELTEATEIVQRVNGAPRDPIVKAIDPAHLAVGDRVVFVDSRGRGAREGMVVQIPGDVGGHDLLFRVRPDNASDWLLAPYQIKGKVER